MDNKSLESQVLALSAVFTCCDGVLNLAKKGQWAEANFAAVIPSLFIRDAYRVADYYPALEKLEIGRDLLLEMVAEGMPKEHLQYVLPVLYVERKLAKNSKLTEKLIIELASAERQKDHFGITSDSLIGRLGEVYVDAVSPAARKIRITGNPSFLRQDGIASRIRTLLLCAVRAAGLWRVNGGGRLQLMFSRQALAQAARDLDLSR